MEGKSIKILFLEDSEDDHELNIISLKRAGIDPAGIRIETKDEFKEQLDKENWDVILADYNLPGFNALDAFEISKESYPEIPMIIVTGVHTEEAAIACIEKGIANYVLKGNLERLPSAVSQALEKRQLEESKKKAENEVKELLRQKDEMIKQLGHDLKTPVSVLLNVLPLIMEEAEKNEVKEDCELALRNVKYIKNLVVETLKIAELSSLHIAFQMEDIDLSSFVNTILDENQLLFEKNNIEIENCIQENVSIIGDELRLKEVFNNLINNAIKFMQEQKKITFYTQDKIDENQVIISIKDSGIGMTPEQSAHVFEEFYKADESRVNFEGSGLGLNICKRIVEAHEGNIWVESPGPGKGSTFHFTLKRGDVENKYP